MASSQIAVAAPTPAPAFAGLIRRLAAHFVDVAFCVSVVIIVGLIVRMLRSAGLVPIVGSTPEQLWQELGIGAKLGVLFGFVLSMGAVYLPLFEASGWQASFGKRILNIYVTDDQGSRITTARALGRWLAKWMLNWFLLWAVSLGTIAGTKNKKALHDMLAKTVVVRGRPLPPVPLEPWRIAVAFGIQFVWLLGTFLSIF